MIFSEIMLWPPITRFSQHSHEAAADCGRLQSVGFCPNEEIDGGSS
jgi:hypothetical protein